MTTLLPDVQITVAVDLSNIDKKIEKIVNNLGRVFNPSKFAGFAMSIMFFGMALQRIFDTIWKQGTKTFQDVMHSVEGTVTQFDILNGSIAYLQFNIGQALEPIVALLVPIIDAMSEWINQHPELFKWIVIIGGVLGALFTVGGAGVLAINGFLDLGVKLGIFSTTATGAIMPTLSLGVALKALTVAGIIGGIILITQWIWNMGEAMGGVGELFKSVVRGILRVLVLVAQGIVDLLIFPINSFITTLNYAIQGVNKLLGTDFKTIKTISTTGILEKYMDWEQNSFLAPEKGYAKDLSLIPQYQQQSSITNNFYGYTGDDVLKAANANR
jgi:hypothetical protein